MKSIFLNSLILILIIFTGCGPTRYNIIPSNPTPNPVYHKENLMVSLGSGYYEKAVPLNSEIQKFIDKENDIDAGGQLFYLRYINEEYRSYNTFVFLRQWLKLKNRKNPWGSVYGGVQFGYASDERQDAIDRNYFYTHIDMGILVGLYRKNFTLVLGPRVGVGVSLVNSALYLFMGPVIQGRIFLIKNLGLGFDICYVLGGGENFLVVPQIYKYSILWRF
ncbi:MAG: hypothetical protein NZ928_00085 [Endomicrobia bacterium]|nr:hypothetical protein [Endomicrobiia bacterium]MCX7956736.1 hypothetical protein [Endomicrobiia bacterium]MDW8055933.1 hypothetical protein [Elusimicrobiota bacterium]